MEHREKKIALRKWRRGDPRDIIRLYKAQILILKQESGKATCQGCSKGFYERKIKKYKQEIRTIKNEKRFRNMNLNENKN